MICSIEQVFRLAKVLSGEKGLCQGRGVDHPVLELVVVRRELTLHGDAAVFHAKVDV